MFGNEILWSLLISLARNLSDLEVLLIQIFINYYHGKYTVCQKMRLV